MSKIDLIKKHKALLSALPDLIFIFDEQGNFVSFDAASDEELFHKPEEFLGKHVSIMPDPIANITMDAIEKTRSSNSLYRYEYSLINPDGIEEFFDARMVPFMDNQYMVLVRDVTYMKFNERLLKQTEAELKAALNSMISAIIIVNTDKKVLSINRVASIRSVIQLGKKTKVGDVISNNSGMNFPKKMIESIDKALKGNVIRYEGNSYDFWYEYIYTPVYDDNEIIGVCLTSTDITAQKTAEVEKSKMQEKIIHHSKLATLGEIATGVAHEINQPLNYISVFLQIMSEELEKDEFDKSYFNEKLQNARKSVGKISNILSQLKSFAKSAPIMKPCLFREALEEAMILMNEKIKLNQIDLSIDIPDNLPRMKINKNMLEQVIINLYQNSIDAFNRNKIDQRKINILIENFPNSKYQIIKFSDNAGGIPEDIRSYIFDPFFSSHSHKDGTGLGLSIVRTIIREAEGDIYFDCNDFNKTEFVITIPNFGHKNESK